jgi:hypothetical protein
MTTSLDKWGGKAYIIRYIEVIEASLEISFDSTWISNLSINKNRNKKDSCRGLSRGGVSIQSPTRLFAKQDSSYYIYNIQIDLNLRAQKMSDRG